MNSSPRSREFDSVYQGRPPWDIDRPQPAVVELERSGRFRGRILDVGCGTGENALHLAARGHSVCGVDFAPTAIATAERKARARGLSARFQVLDALRLKRMNETFDTVLDCGLFHTFSDEERPTYVESLYGVLAAGASAFILCFSEREPDWGGPRRVTQADLRETFSSRFRVAGIHPARFDTNRSGLPAFAWLAEMIPG